MTPAGPACHACGTALPAATPGFRDLCPTCSAWLHACLNCRHHDAAAHYQCRAAATAEFVQDKVKFNFCGEFAPGAAGGGGPTPKSRAEIEKMFPGGS